MVVDRGGAPRVVEAARAQGRIDPRQHRLRALQQGKAVARQRLGLFEIFDELLEVLAHALVPGHDEHDSRHPCLCFGAYPDQCRQHQKQAGKPAHGELSEVHDP